MDTARGFEDDRIDSDIGDEPDMAVNDAAAEIGTDERRMHVRAYNHWVSLLGGRAYPAIEDLDPANIADFGPNSVLLDFSAGIEDPSIRFLGRALREECGLPPEVDSIAQVPSRSLLSRLTDHYLQIIANRAPIGFEAEFIASRGNPTLYRGILMPFSSDEDTIDFIYGVINWKELVDAETQARLDAEVDAALRTAPTPVPAATAWADGPNSRFDEERSSGGEESDDLDRDADRPVAGLADQLLLARQTAAAVRAADTRSRAALYRALGRAHDFALTAADDQEGYHALLADAGISAQARAPMTPVVKLVFGADYDKTRLTEFAAVLGHAQRNGIARGALAGFLETAPGGIKGVVKAERAARRPAAKPDRLQQAAESLNRRDPIATIALDTDAVTGEFVLLLARAAGPGMVDIVAQMGSADALTGKAIRRAAD